ncbi:MAG: hypothetical protein FJ145_05815 [Deltaproteobacteria bacterium]|nr:hypothetical protein [Deltaproteobacteria bacterium]
MALRDRAVRLLVWFVLLGGCRGHETTVQESAPPLPAVSKGEASGEPAIRARIHATLPEFRFNLIGEKSSDGTTLQVKKIEIRRANRTEPVQVIEGLDANTPLNPGVAPLEALDMNFDGYEDIRIIAFQPAGPNVPYRNWLYDPTAGRFLESAALNEITAPEFDAPRKQIRSSWRDGATRYGTDIYVYENGKPVVVRKETKDYQAPGRYTLRVSQRVNGAWKVSEQRAVREP